MVEASWFSKIKDKEYFASVSNPQFLELDGLIILEAHYRPDSFASWTKKLINTASSANFQRVENTVNHVHLDDLVDEPGSQIEVGQYLQEKWLDKLKTQFPNYEFECKLNQFEEDWELELWKQR